MNKNRIRLSESQLRKVIKESVRNVLKEAYIGRGKNTTRGSSSSSDDYHSHANFWKRTSENPYSSDGALMLANRLEKRLGEGFTVEVYNEQSYRHDYEWDEDYRDGGDLKFVISYDNDSEIQNVYYMINVVKKMFGDNAHSIDFETNDDSLEKYCVFYVDSSKLLGNEPRRDMLPKSGAYSQSIVGSEFKKPEYDSYTEY